MQWYSEEAALWHAFDALDERRVGTVPKSKLKVLAHNLGQTYISDGQQSLDNKLDEIEDKNELSFDDFRDFLKNNLSLSPINKNLLVDGETANGNGKKLSVSEVKKRNSDVSSPFRTFNDICWMLCGKLYVSREADSLTEVVVQKLWDIFCFLAERDDKQVLVVPVCLDCEEVEHICRKFLDLTGQSVSTIEQCILNENHTSNFSTFLLTFVSNCVSGMQPREIEASLADLHEFFIKDCLKKGVLLKKGNAKPLIVWKERYFILSTKCLEYYKLGTGTKKELKGVITIEESHTVEGIPDRHGAKPQRLSYSTGTRTYEMSASDIKTRNEWIFLLKASIANCTKASYQQEACKARRTKRHESRMQQQLKKEREQEESERIQQTISEIEAEKEARGEALIKLKEEAELRDAEQRRLHELAEQKREELERERLSRLEAESRMQAEAEEHLKELQSKMTEDIELERKTREENELRIQAEAEERLKKLECKMTEDIMLQKQAREDAENKLSIEESLRLAEEERVSELEELNSLLKKLLEDEQLARKDEETVRCLQARILEEEFEKREEMEKLQEQLSDMFAAEKQKSEDLEQEKLAQEQLLENAMEQKRLLEEERLDAELKMKDAMKRLEDAEIRRAELESRIKKKHEKPVGLARPLQVEARPLVTHRGEGAFVEADFMKFDN